MGNGISFDAGKCKVLLKQATTRMRILSNKLTNQTKVQRREIAELLDKGKIESAHVKVEHIIRDDYYIEVYEILQLYIGLVLARIPLLKAPKKNLEKGQQPPPPQHEIREAICTLLYASGCLEVEELREFGKQMSACYGMDFVKECLENRSEFVSFKVVSKLTFQSPDQSIVQGYLEIIAAQYDVEYTAPPPAKVNEPLSNFCGPAIDKGSGTQVFPTFDAPGPQGPPMPPPPPGGGGMPGMPPPPGAWGAPAPGTLPEPPLRPPGGPPPPGGDYAYQDPFAGLPAVPGAPEAGTQFRRTSSAERIKAHRDSPRHTPDMPGYTPGNPDAPYGGMPSFPPPGGGAPPAAQVPSFDPAKGMLPSAPGPAPPAAPVDFDALFPSVPGGPAAPPPGPPGGQQDFTFHPAAPSNPAAAFPPPAAAFPPPAAAFPPPAAAFPPPAAAFPPPAAAFPPPAAAFPPPPPAPAAAPSGDFSFDLPSVPGGPPGQQPPSGGGGPPSSLGTRPDVSSGGDDAEDLMARFAALRRGGT